MNDKQLDRSLRSIGKECFVKYFNDFSNLNIKAYDLIDILMKKEKYTETGCRTRVSQSRRIIRQGRARDALRDIAKSGRVNDSIRQIAGDLARSM